MTHAADIHQRKSNQQSFAITTGILAGLLLLLLFIKLQHPIIEDAITGVMIDFGDNKEGLGDDNEHDAGGQNSAPQKVVQAKPEPVHSTPTPITPVKTSSPVKTPPNNTVVSEDPQAVAIAKMKKEEEEKKRKEDQRIAEAVKKAEAERIAREAKAAEDRRIQQEANQKVAGVFSKGKTGTGNGTGNSSGSGSGSGQGNSKPGGNQGAQWGAPGGDPNGTGTGTNGSGPGSGNGASYNLIGRTWHPNLPTNTTQKTGKVVVTIRVDRKGNVLYAKYQQKGSTTTDVQLIQIAEEGARRSKFSENPNAEAEQIGTITYNFIVN
jgi:outer membrane biosynthesis protein TonB